MLLLSGCDVGAGKVENFVNLRVESPINWALVAKDSELLRCDIVALSAAGLAGLFNHRDDAWFFVAAVRKLHKSSLIKETSEPVDDELVHALAGDHNYKVNPEWVKAPDQQWH